MVGTWLAVDRARKWHHSNLLQAGVAYVRETLGHVLNYNMQTHGEEGLTISREAVADTEEVLSKFSLLTVCQEVFVAILQVCNRFRERFLK